MLCISYQYVYSNYWCAGNEPTCCGPLVFFDALVLKLSGRSVHNICNDNVLLLLVLENAFVKNFADVNVNVVDCPDLTQPPFSLAASGEYPTVNFVLLFRSLIVDVIHYS